MNFSTNFLPENLTSALGWTLLHSLWQAALVSVVVALLLIVLNRHAAQVRYKAAIAGMAAVFLLFTGTFVHYYTASENTAVAVPASFVASTGFSTTATPAPPNDASLWERATSTGKAYFVQHMPLFVSLWLMGLLLMALRFLGGLAYVQRLRHYKAKALGRHWQETLAVLQRRMGTGRTVRLVESVLVQVPMSIGYLKPVILLPLGAVTGLSQKQLEAILAHELAHITRHDYLFNLLQQVVEALFFFHPAIWWLSGVVRTEREHCCDDLAVAACGDTVVYAQALAQLEELRLPAAPGFALALTGKKGSLLSRIKRLIMRQELRPSFGEGFAAALVIVCGLVLLSFGAWAGLKSQQPQDLQKQEVGSSDEQLSETEKSIESTPSSDSDTFMATVLTVTDTTGGASNLIIIKNKKGDIAELYVNGRRVPNKDIPEFQQLIDERLKETRRAPRMKGSEREAALQAARSATAGTGNPKNRGYSHADADGQSKEFNMNFNFDMPPMPAMAPLPPMPPLPPMAPLSLFGNTDEKSKKELKQQQEQYEKEMKAYEQEMKAYEQEVKAHEEEVKKLQLKASTADSGQQVNLSEAQRRRYEASVSRQKEQLRRHEMNMKNHEANMRRHSINMEEHRFHAEIMENVRKEMLKDGLLKENAEITDFRIDETGLFIQGEKQSQVLYEKYRGLMKSKDGKPLNMTYKKSETGEHLMIK